MWEFSTQQKIIEYIKYAYYIFNLEKKLKNQQMCIAS